MLGAEVPGHRREQLTQTLIVRLLRTHFFTPILVIVKSQWNIIELVTTRPDQDAPPLADVLEVHLKDPDPTLALLNVASSLNPLALIRVLVAEPNKQKLN